jgi:RNA polymerase sigma-32 factor
MSTNLSLVNSMPIVQQDGLPQYLRTVNNIPLLSAEEESSLAISFREHGDLKSAQKLVLSHLRYVVKVARGFNGYGLAFADLIQEGTIGLMKAVKRFDPSMNVRLVTFAMHWIKAEIHEFIIRNWRIVKVATTKAQRKLFFNLRKAKSQLGWFSKSEIQMVADDLGVKPNEVLEMEQRLHAHDSPFDAQDDDDDNAFLSPSHQLAASSCDPAMNVQDGMHQDFNHSNLHSALLTLDARSQDIIQARWLSEDKSPLKILADKYDISIERVRQLEKAAMQKLRDALPQE